MKNIENMQKNESLESTVNPALRNTEFVGHKADCPKIRLGGTLEQMCMLVLAIVIATVSIFDANWKGLLPAGICAGFYFIPVIIKAIRRRKRINAENVCGILKSRGLSPVICGDEIRWNFNGKESILRIHSPFQVEIAREYDIPSNSAVVSGNERAAVETMKDVYLAKVSVHKNSGHSKLAFSTESLCISLKALSAYIPMCLAILDMAEKCQQQNLAEVSESSKKTTRKIGFVYSRKGEEGGCQLGADKAQTAIDIGRESDRMQGDVSTWGGSYSGFRKVVSDCKKIPGSPL